MALSFVGSNSDTALNGGDITLDLSGIGLQEDDVVYCVVGSGHANARSVDISESSGTWTRIGAEQDHSDNTTITGTVFRKVQGATPDSDVTFNFSGTNTDDGQAAIAHAWRGADTTTPEDATMVVATGSGNNPDCGSITTVTDGAVVLAMATAQAAETSIVAPSGYENLAQDNANDVRDCSIAAASKEVTTAGAEDPPEFTDWTISSTNPWVGFTVAIRPAAEAAVEQPIQRVVERHVIG